MLQRTLASFSNLEIPANCRHEILLVDNRSTDHTAEIIDQWQNRLPLIRLQEETPGHVAARNCAVRASSGQLLLWTDDDVEVSRDWLKVYVSAAERGPEYDFWGGRIKPEFTNGRPPWIAENWEMVQGCFAARDLGPQPIDFTVQCLPYGANFAVRGELQRDILFETGLGRVGREVVGQDEIYWMKQVIGLGHRGHWVPSGEVSHLIPPDRASADYIFNYFRGQGRLLNSKGESWSRSGWWLYLLNKWHRWNFRRYEKRPPSGRWLAHLIRAGLAQGQLDAMARR